MDASILRGKDAAIHCHECGYPRRGLPATSVCPECGTSPDRASTVVRGLPTLTITQQGQIRLVAIGLMLLLYASFYSMQLAVVMNYEQLSLHAINLPSPKIAAVTLVQREIGGRPGPWGTMGWTCVLFQLVSVYLITVPTLKNAVNEAWFSLRRVCRWTALICTAALMGFMLSHGQSYIPLLSWYTWDLLLYALVIGELPTNLFLYLYLARLADTARQPRLALSIRWLAWIGVFVRLTCVAVLVYPFPSQEIRNDMQALVLASLACFAIPAGVVGWAAILTLAIRMLRLGFTKPARRMVALARDRAPVVRNLMHLIERHGPRACVALGLVLWLLAIASQFSAAVGAYPGRQGLGGELPLLNYAGPKISAAWIGSSDYAWRFSSEQSVAVGSMLLIVFLLTAKLPGLTDADDRLRNIVRWGTLVLIAARAGWLLNLDADVRGSTLVRVTHVVLLEAPATFAMLWYLARLARLELLPGLQRRLRQWAVVSVTLMGLPLSLHVLSKHTWNYHNSWQIAIVGVLYGVVTVTAGVMGVRQIATLAWAIARPIWIAPARSTDADQRVQSQRIEIADAHEMAKSRASIPQ